MRAPPVLADLDRRLYLARDLGVTGKIVGRRWLFDPANRFAVEQSSASHRIWDVERLVVVDHNAQVRATLFLRAAHDREIGFGIGIADLVLDASESGGQRFLGLTSGMIDSDHAEAVVNRDRSRFPAEK